MTGTPTVSPLYQRRLERWHQTPETRIPDPEAAARFITCAGLATLFASSPEIPNLFYAYVGDAAAKTDSKWDSPSGEVFGWRWDLGRKEAAFYSVVVRKNPTWVSWPLLPAILRLRGEQRTPDELYDLGEISANAYRIVQALESSGGVLATSELRKAAGFPIGKEHTAAYRKAVEELDTRLFLAKAFSPDDLDMRHALVWVRYPDQVATADRMTAEEALEQLLRVYLPSAVFAAPTLLARHLGVPGDQLLSGLERLEQTGLVEQATVPGYKELCYVWRDV